MEFCRQLKERGDNVIATCRTPSPELEELGVRVESDVEVTSTDSILRLRQRLNEIKLDCLIQNAGIAEYNSLSTLDSKSILRQFEVNALSPLCFSQAMMSNMGKGSKIVLITSRMGSIEDNTSGSSYGYRMSKVALCMAGKSLSIDLKPKGISVGILHPGLVSTRMTSFTRQGISAEHSVKGLVGIIDSLNIKNSGTFWHSNGEILPW